MNLHRSRRAFTIVELLVVISIIILLSAMVLVGASVMMGDTKKAATKTILAAVRKGLELTMAARGGSVSPSEHPFAGSRPNRSQFWGTRGRSLNPDGTLNLSSGSLNKNLDTSSEALKGCPEWYMAANQSQALMDDDWFADPNVPLLFGMQRGYLTILGSQLEAVTLYRRLPPRPPDGVALLPTPYTDPTYKDSLYLIQPTGLSADNKKSLDYLFGSSDVASELSSLKALYAPPDDLAINLTSPPTPRTGNNTDGLPIDNGGRVWSDDTGKGKWEAGTFKDTSKGMGKAMWRKYRLRGLAIYDAWGREVLCSISGGNSIRLLSAGADGVFKWFPGSNGVLETDANATAPSGDDKDGSKDNVSQGVSE